MWLDRENGGRGGGMGGNGGKWGRKNGILLEQLGEMGKEKGIGAHLGWVWKLPHLGFISLFSGEGGATKLASKRQQAAT